MKVSKKVIEFIDKRRLSVEFFAIVNKMIVRIKEEHSINANKVPHMRETATKGLNVQLHRL